MGIIGITEQYLHDRIDRRTYVEMYERFKDEVSRLNTNFEATQRLDLDRLSQMGDEDRLGMGDGDGSTRGSSGAKTASDKSITSEDREFRLMLFRHWSFYEAMYNSSYVATKLGIWKEKGKGKLVYLMAQMG